MDAAASVELNAPQALDIAGQICRRFESCRLEAYHCAADRPGLWTIGWGATSCGGAPVQEGLTISQEEADDMLASTLEETRMTVADAVETEMTPWQEGALISFAYNAGCGAFRASRILRCLNDGDLDGAAADFANWCHAGGRTVEGLVRRRAFERAVFTGDILP